MPTHDDDEVARRVFYALTKDKAEETRRTSKLLALLIQHLNERQLFRRGG
jgi:hypothetical protein